MQKKIILWKGYHSQLLMDLVSDCWKKDNLLILCPPYLKNISFVQHFDKQAFIFQGCWTSEEKMLILSHESSVKQMGNELYTKFTLGVFTSGTTSGIPRLVLYTKNNVEIGIDSVMSLFDRNRIKKIFAYPQPFHGFGLIFGYAFAYLHRRTLLIPEGSYSRNYHNQWLKLEEPHLLTLGTPTHFNDLIDHAHHQAIFPKESYAAIMGGAKVECSLWQAVQENLNITHPSIGYGCTEACMGITHSTPGRKPIEEGEIGTCLPHIQMTANENGIVIGGPSLCQMIIEGELLTEPEVIQVNDYIEERPHGSYIYQFRVDALLNRGGEKFNLEFIENKLCEQFNVDCMCVAVPDQRLGFELGILVQASSDFADINELKTVIYRYLQVFCHRQFDTHYFKIVEYLPVNMNTKRDRKAGLLLFTR